MEVGGVVMEEESQSQNRKAVKKEECTNGIVFRNSTTNGMEFAKEGKTQVRIIIMVVTSPSNPHSPGHVVN
jgi:hypothetical protein